MTSGTNAVGKNSCLLIILLLLIDLDSNLTYFILLEMVEMDEMNQRAISTQNFGIGGLPRNAVNFSSNEYEDIEADQKTGGVRKRNRGSNGYGEDFDGIDNEDFPTEGQPEDGSALSPSGEDTT